MIVVSRGRNMSEDEKLTIDRRELLRGGAVLAGGALLGSTEAHSASSQAVWDREFDVVVIGSGTGLVAALVAARAGKRVLILEKHSAPGGSTVVSGGIPWIPNNNVMKREGLNDSEEQALQYLRKLAQGQAEEKLIQAFVAHGPEMIDYVEAHTTITWRVSQMLGAVADYHPEWPGSNIRGRSLEPVQPGVSMAGGLLISALLDAIRVAGGELLLATPARKLLWQQTESGRRVVGVLAEHNGERLRIRASRGVLMASGGFERNEEMKKHFLRGPSPYTLGAESNCGDGILMGMDAGADLRNMNEVWGITVYKDDAEANGDRRGGISLMGQIDRRNPGCIAVNRYGERFCNEAADYDSTWRSYHTWENWGELGYRNLPAFHIFDHTSRMKYGIFGRQASQALPTWVVQADTLQQLAGKLGIDADGLVKTVELFNRNARSGSDPQFHRGESIYDTYGSTDTEKTLAPLIQGPFYGAEISPADLGTCGGLRVDERARVIDVFGGVVHGLFASGNTAGVGSPGASYGGGGGTIGPAMTFAYIAGMQLLEETDGMSPGEPHPQSARYITSKK
ncbi:FAD-binding dehydrogenase [Pseudohalioglobus lutimaris]|uniref:FAD-binding dehydrogenase n=2 Tax=Pseudohalioglobus lutimaris TaxID=1737061 RepID=A0A2N5WWY9_9GAMM|nr:FAD-binding dehydrogenase [Pseudohalioglobus lutimaris]